MQIEKAIINALKETDCPIYEPILNPNGIIPIIANLDQPEPRAPYLLINVINTEKIGMPYKSVVNDGINIKEHIFQVKDFYVGLTLHAKNGDESQDWFQHFENGVHSDMVDWAFTLYGLALVESDNILYQHTALSGTSYNRANMNIVLRAEIQDSYKVNYINRVNIKGELIDSLDSITSDVIVDVSN